MHSAFGVDHGEVSKGIGNAAGKVIHSAGIKMAARGNERASYGALNTGREMMGNGARVATGGSLQRLGARMLPKQGPRVSPQFKMSNSRVQSSQYKPGSRR